MSGVGFATFLDQIAQTWPADQLVLVMENVSYHRAPAVAAWWAVQDGRITPFWFPASTPILNLMEAHVQPGQGPSIFLRNDFCESA